MSYEPSHRKPPRQERWPSATPGEGWPAYQQGDDGRAWEPVQAFAGSRNGYDAAGNGYGAAGNGYGAAGNGYGAAGNGYGAPSNSYDAASDRYGAPSNGYGDTWGGRRPTADGYGDAWGGARYSDPGQGYWAGGNGYGGTTTAYPAVGDGYVGDGYVGDGYVGVCTILRRRHQLRAVPVLGSSLSSSEFPRCVGRESGLVRAVLDRYYGGFHTVSGGDHQSAFGA